LKTNKISLLILNSRLPDENGFDFCRRIKKNKNWRQLPVLLLKEKGAREADFTRSLASFSSENPIKKEELIYLAEKLIDPVLEDTLVEYILPEEEKHAAENKVEQPLKKTNNIEKELNDLINAVKPTLSASQTSAKSSEKTAEVKARKVPVKSDQAIKKELEDLYRLIK
jgi:response regulator RpfG family c-di-GMP phosphodiesterase